MKAGALVVDDDPVWRDILCEILGDLGFVVDLASDYVEAAGLIRAVAHRLAVIDLCLNADDYRNQDGLKVLRYLKVHNPLCKSVLLTGFATVELAVGALKDYGAVDCIQKEMFDRARLERLVGVIPVYSEYVKCPFKKRLPKIGEDSVANALLVDDDAGWRDLLQELLEDIGFEVLSCSSFAEARGLLKTLSFSLAVVDLSLATSVSEGVNRDGLFLLKSAWELGIPSMVVTGTAEPEQIELVYSDYGVVACWEKCCFSRERFSDSALTIYSNFISSRLEGREKSRGAEELLTSREQEVMDLVAQGMTNREIAEKLYVSVNTVKSHLKAIFDKLKVKTRAAAVAKYSVVKGD